LAIEPTDPIEPASPATAPDGDPPAPGHPEPGGGTEASADAETAPTAEAAPAGTADTTPGPVAGLRERKKQRTRDALARAALELFTTQGFERTTVDEIAEAVDVSQRTFFRYFASKEEAAFTVQDLVQSHFLRLLRSRPPGESPVEAMRNAVLTGWETIGDAVHEIVSLDLHMRSYLMIESTPSLLAVHLRRSMEVGAEAAAIIAEREGLDPETDPRPWVAVAAFDGVMRVAAWRWAREENPSPERIRELTASHLDRLGPALAGSWRGEERPHSAPAASGSGTGAR
jgi:AcrR family transcriptional regulator